MGLGASSDDMVDESLVVIAFEGSADDADGDGLWWIVRIAAAWKIKESTDLLADGVTRC
jgi:hypothetical protein